eukprot:7260976-Prymnesium_polylepis.1
MAQVRRHSGEYDLALPWFVPHNQSSVDLMNIVHPACLDCHHHPPTHWTSAQVAQQVSLAGLQGASTPPLADVGAVFAKHHVHGHALLNISTRR